MYILLKMITVVLTFLVSAVRQAVAVGLALIQYLKNRQKTHVRCQCQNRVRGKVVIITGASSGIGYSTALDLARKGAVVYLGCRNKKSGEKAQRKICTVTGNQGVYFLQLDLTDSSSVRSFVNKFLKCEEKLDALVNNAAVFHHPSELTKDEIEVTYQTNYLGAFLLTTLLQDTISRTSSSRIVFVSSEAHKLVSSEDLINFDPTKLRTLKTFSDHVNHYGTSKLALHWFAQYLVEKVPDVLVMLVNPGNVWTPIYRHSWQSWSELSIRIQCFLFMRDTEEGSQSTIHALNAPNLTSGKYIGDDLQAEEKVFYDVNAVEELVAKSRALTAEK